MGKKAAGAKPPRGDIHIIKERCKGCGYCIEFCPRGVLAQSDEFNAKGHHPPTLREEPPAKVCIACCFCTRICPEFAIYCVVSK
jgi:2-oxoglutarate ferredoxin oxidoreductase subunit delta